jgi:hypothetical protein
VALLRPALEEQLMITVLIYDADGAALRWRGGMTGRGVFDVRFTSGLPGGFLEASFGLPRAAARLAGIRAGQRVEMRRGNRVVWTGWIEDIKTRQRGGVDAMTVQCLGPYQVLHQRLIPSVAYTADQQGSDAIRQELMANCPEISTDYTHIQATNVSIGPLTKSYMPVGDVVDSVLKAGNADGKQMLFAIWEPPVTIAGSDLLHARNVLLNADFEAPDWYGWIVDVYSNGDYEITNSAYLSAFHSGKVFNTSAIATGSLTLRNGFMAVDASTPYQFDYSFYWPAISGITAQVSIKWYTSLSVLISTVSGTLWTSAGTAGWNSKSEYFTSPAGAAFCIAYLAAAWPAGLSKYLLWDDCYLSKQISAATKDGLPRAWLWPRDLSQSDLLLHTRLLADGFDVNASTRELSNRVVASYGSSSYTAAVDDANSQGLYRRRDRLVSAGSAAGSGVAAAMRNAYLATYSSPLEEPAVIAVRRHGAITTPTRRPVNLTDVRAGQRLRVADGPMAGMTMLLERVEWSDGVLRCTPEQRPDMAELLARL